MSELQVRLFVSSPSDVKAERDRVVSVVDRLNGRFEGVVRIEVIRWEDEFYTSTRSFQEQIDTAVGRMAQINILICILWGRIGLKLDPAIWQRHAHNGYESGTTYEYEVAVDLNKRNNGVPDLYLFRKSAPILYRADCAAEDIEQHRVLETVWKRWTQSTDGYNAAGYQTFSHTDEFEKQIEGCLRQWLERQGVLVTGPVWDRRVKGSPFCGLAAFEPSHSSVFFGRDAAIAHITAKIRTSCFLLVIGASGTGKSSLLRAGLVPHLSRPGVVPDIDLWRTVTIAPSKDIFLDLTQALSAETCLGSELKEIGCTVEHLVGLFRQGGDEALALIQSALANAAQARAESCKYNSTRPARVLLAIDQLERLFVEARPDEIGVFASLLRDLIAKDLAFVVAMLRSDAYGNFQSVEAFSALREAGATHDLLPPNAHELEDIVTQPVLACHPPLTFETDTGGKSLAELLVNDARGGDSLPLLQMTLESLFQAEKIRGDGILGFSDYGGMERAVIQVASEAFADIDQPARDSVPALITAFVHDLSFDPVSAKRTVTLRPIVRDAFERGRPERAALVDAFLARRLLTVEDFSGEIRIRPVHEALLRVWPEATQILTENETIIRVRRTLEPLVDQWIDGGQTADSDLLLTSPALLAGAQQLVQRMGDDVLPPMRSYIAASLAAETQRSEYELQGRTAIMTATGGMRARSIPYYRLVAGLLLALLLLIRIANPPVVEWLGTVAFDTYQRISPRVRTATPAVIIDIDEASLSEIGWPWPRTVMADLVTQLSKLGAVVIGFDIVFADPDRTSPDIAAGAFRGLDPETRDRLLKLPSNDTVLAEAIKRAGRVVISQGGLPLPASLSDDRSDPFVFLGRDPRDFLFKFSGLLRNIPAIEQAAAGRGLISIRAERDGVIRRVPMISETQQVLRLSLPMEMLRIATGSEATIVKSGDDGVRSLGLRGLTVPTDHNGQLWLHYGYSGPARFVSAADVLGGRTPPERIRGKLVLIGSSALGLNDLRSTPLSPSMPGVEIQAEVLENILTDSMLVRPYYAPLLEVSLIIAIATILSIVMPLLSARTLVVLSGGMLIALVVGGWAAFKYWRLLIDPIYPVVTMVTFIMVLTFHIYRYSETQRGNIRQFFESRLKRNDSRKPGG
jgi:CHASE2 domain-containing sensor protein/energy-coupling factor transporter ATP-binding protein EcfA2